MFDTSKRTHHAYGRRGRFIQLYFSITYRCVYVGEADAFGTRGILGHHCFLGLCYIFIVWCPKYPGYGAIWDRNVVVVFGYYADINSQIEKLVAKCIANI